MNVQIQVWYKGRNVGSLIDVGILPRIGESIVIVDHEYRIDSIVHYVALHSVPLAGLNKPHTRLYVERLT